MTDLKLIPPETRQRLKLLIEKYVGQEARA
jgi:hypothetical protein